MKYSMRRNNSDDRPMAEINVTPLVDVMLVLLIIFMVTAPMMQTGIDVNLPRVKAKTMDVTEEKLVLTINDAKEIFLNKTRMSLRDIGSKTGIHHCVSNRPRGLFTGGQECPLRIRRRGDGRSEKGRCG